MSLTQPSLETSTPSTLGHAPLLSLLGFRDLQPLIAQASHEEQTFEQSLQDAYEDYLTSQDQYSIQTLHQALTTTIEQLERERATALDHTRWREKTVQTSDGVLKWLKDGFLTWFGWGAEDEERHYSAVAEKIDERLNTFFRFRDSIAASLTRPQRRLLQDNSFLTPDTRQQYYCNNGDCKLPLLSNGVSGFQLQGEANSFLGGSVYTAGDMNGDGFADIIIGAAGKAFILFGSNSSSAWSNGNLSTSSFMDGQRGVVLQDGTTQSLVVSTAGDINGDGLADVLLGNANTSRTFVVFGSNRTNAWGNGILNLSSLMDGQRGFVLHGAGASVSTAGDVNGDRLTDFIVGDVVSDSGNVYVFFGNRSDVWGNGTLNISSLMNGQRGFALHGDSGQFIGRTVSAGDINGDGFDDVLVGSFVDYIFVVFGSNSSTAWSAGHFNLSTLLDGQRGFGCAGEGSYASGSPVSALGDINGDRLADFMVRFSTTVYVVFGSNASNAWSTGITSISSLMNGQRGFSIVAGIVPISAAGDVNDDGLNDFIVGPAVLLGFKLPNVTSGGQLASYLQILRGSQFATPDLGLGSVSAAGDINGDGFADLIFGAPGTATSFVVISRIFSARFTANNLQLAVNQRITLSPQQFSISVPGGVANPTVLFDNVDQGYFSLLSSPNLIQDTFSLQDLLAEQVQFVHTGNAVAPRYRVCVVDSILFLKMCSDAQVKFLGYLPTLINNQLTVNQGQPTVLQASDLSAQDQDGDSPSHLTFMIFNPIYGQFAMFNHSTNVTSTLGLMFFTQQDVLDGRIQFLHNGSRAKPAYMVMVNDTKSVTRAQAAKITFNFAPELNVTMSAITLDQGKATTLSSGDISASDEETFQGSILIKAENITAGHFAYSSNLDFPITTFQQLSLITGEVRFVQDGSELVPNFALCAFDGVLRSPWHLPRIYLNHRPVRYGDAIPPIEVLPNQDFHFTLGNFVRFGDPDQNDTLTYRAQLKGGSPLPSKIRFTPPDQFSGNLPDVGSFNIEVEAIDPRGLTASTYFVLSTGGFDIQSLYTSLWSMGGVGLTMLAYLWLRRRIAIHRRKFPFVNDLRKVLNLEYYDFTRFDGDAYKTKVNDFFVELRWNHPDFYAQLTAQEKKSFAVCVAEILTKRGLVTRSGNAGGLFGVFCLLNVGWPNELDLGEFESQGRSIAAQAVAAWKSAVVAQKDYQKPLNRWPYFSPSKREKLCVCCCCAKPASFNRWRVDSTLELKKREGDHEETSVELSEHKH